jgi:hypothetical protein
MFVLSCVGEVRYSSLERHSKIAFQVSFRASGSAWHNPSNIFKASTFLDLISLGACRKVNLHIHRPAVPVFTTFTIIMNSNQFSQAATKHARN